jgi:hypothetical protein
MNFSYKMNMQAVEMEGLTSMKIYKQEISNTWETVNFKYPDIQWDPI